MSDSDIHIIELDDEEIAIGDIPAHYLNSYNAKETGRMLVDIHITKQVLRELYEEIQQILGERSSSDIQGCESISKKEIIKT